MWTRRLRCACSCARRSKPISALAALLQDLLGKHGIGFHRLAQLHAQRSLRVHICGHSREIVHRLLRRGRREALLQAVEQRSRGQLAGLLQTFLADLGEQWHERGDDGSGE